MLMQSTTMMMNPTSVVENNWAEIWRYSQWEILSLSIWVTGVMNRIVWPRKKYGLSPKQIQSNISPNLRKSVVVQELRFPIKMKYEKQSGEIQLMVSLDRSQSLFDFVPQEKGLIWRPLWGRKNMGESIFHWEDGPPWGKMHPYWCSNMPRIK